jgi:hypothetical protein
MTNTKPHRRLKEETNTKSHFTFENPSFLFKKKLFVHASGGI